MIAVCVCACVCSQRHYSHYITYYYIECVLKEEESNNDIVDKSEEAMEGT